MSSSIPFLSSPPLLFATFLFAFPSILRRYPRQLSTEHVLTLLYLFAAALRVYLGTNAKTDQLAAVKVINLTAPAAGRPSRKELEKEVKVHRMMKHQYVLEFYDAVLVEEGGEFIPGLFMLLEYASMGDLFDKISEFTSLFFGWYRSLGMGLVLRRSL